MGTELERVVGLLAGLAVQSGFGAHLEQRIKDAEVKLEELPVLGPMLQALFPGLPAPAPKAPPQPAPQLPPQQVPQPPAGGSSTPS